MLSLQAAVLLAACSVSDTTLIDFSAEWCGPCRQMEPVVAQLTAMGYPVRKVNIDHDQALASQFHVQSIPCLVLVVDGREVERTVGFTSQQQLIAMLNRHGVTAGGAANSKPKEIAQAEPPRASAAAGTDLAPQLIAASVRLKISDSTGHSYGSGTIIDVRGDEALVATCGHIFRDSQGQGKVMVDLFGTGAPHGLAGRVVGYDLKSDVGLVSFKPGCPVRPATLAPAGYQVRRGDAVINVGCNNGGEPTAKSSRVTSLDKFVGTPNIEVAGQPIQGRSGGGLFTVDGRVIGICNAADPTDNEGLYAAISSLWTLLEKHAWTPELVIDRPDALANASVRELPRGNGLVPVMPRTMPATPTIATATSSPEASQRAAIAALAAQSPSAEVICIVRSPDPHAQSEVIVLDKASPEFIDRLAAERIAQRDRSLTSLAQREEPPLTSPSSRGNVVRNAPVVNVRNGSAAATSNWRPNWLRPQ